MPRVETLLLDGDIDPLSFEMSRAQVETLLGEAEGVIQLHYQQGHLCSVKWSIVDQGEMPIPLIGDLPKPTTTLYQFLDRCNDNEISWLIDQSQSFDRQLAIRTCAKVMVLFDLDFQELQQIIVTGVPHE